MVDGGWASEQLIRAAQGGDLESIIAAPGALFDHHDFDEGGFGPVESAEDQVLQRLEAERVAEQIRALPDLQRRVLIMRDVLGYPGRTVAETLGPITAAMKSSLHRARTALRLGVTDNPVR